MGLIAWIGLLAWAALLATVGQYLFFRDKRGPNDYDWVYTAGGALVGGFTAHVWYPGFGPVIDGLNAIPALVGGIVGAVLIELVYPFVLRRRIKA